MSNIPFSFNAAAIKPMTEYTLLEPGMYKVIIDTIETKPTKAGDGGYLEFKYKIVEGPRAGAFVFSRLNLWNQNVKAVEMAHSELSAICHVTNVMAFNSLEELNRMKNIPFNVKVDYQLNDKKEPNGNRIMSYRDLNGNEPGKSSPGPIQQAPTQAAPAQAPAQQAWGAPAPAPAQQAAPWGGQPAAAPAQAWGNPAQAPVQPQQAAPAAPWGGPQAGPAQPHPAAPAATMPPQQAWGAPTGDATPPWATK